MSLGKCCRLTFPLWEIQTIHFTWIYSVISVLYGSNTVPKLSTLLPIPSLFTLVSTLFTSWSWQWSMTCIQFFLPVIIFNKLHVNNISAITRWLLSGLSHPPLSSPSPCCQTSSLLSSNHLSAAHLPNAWRALRRWHGDAGGRAAGVVGSCGVIDAVNLICGLLAIRSRVGEWIGGGVSNIAFHSWEKKGWAACV